MKQSLLTVIGLALVGLVSCKDEEPKIHPIVGEWELDGIVISDPPSGYEIATSPDQVSWYGETSYSVTFFEDFTYERELRSSSSKFTDEGSYELSGDDLDLDQEDSDLDDLVTSFTIEGEITDRSMTLVATDLWYAWPPEIVNSPEARDTADTQEKINALFEEYGVVVEFTFTAEFDKQ